MVINETGQKLLNEIEEKRKRIEEITGIKVENPQFETNPMHIWEGTDNYKTLYWLPHANDMFFCFESNKIARMIGFEKLETYFSKEITQEETLRR